MFGHMTAFVNHLYFNMLQNCELILYSYIITP